MFNVGRRTDGLWFERGAAACTRKRRWRHSRPTCCYNASSSERARSLWTGMNVALVLCSGADPSGSNVCGHRREVLGGPRFSNVGVAVGVFAEKITSRSLSGPIHALVGWQTCLDGAVRMVADSSRVSFGDGLIEEMCGLTESDAVARRRAGRHGGARHLPRSCRSWLDRGGSGSSGSALSPVAPQQKCGRWRRPIASA